ncbi:MAG: sterol desaturase family protein [Bacteroidota bacterium]
MPAFLLLVLFENGMAGARKRHCPQYGYDQQPEQRRYQCDQRCYWSVFYYPLLSFFSPLPGYYPYSIHSPCLYYRFFALDFAGYWVHRLQHVSNFFWNGHIVHHSSEEFNLACALRQSISSIVKTFAIFLLPAALLGVSADVVNVVAPLHLFAQFWYHTQHISKMGFLERSSSLPHIIVYTMPSIGIPR